MGCLEAILIFATISLVTTESDVLSKFDFECTRESPSRHLISVPFGNLTFREKKHVKSAGHLPCQWFIDGTAHGTNVVFAVTQIIGECPFQSCVLVFDGDSLEDPPAASLSPFVENAKRELLSIVSSSPKIFVQVAAGCQRLSLVNATFRVINCTGCSGDCSAGLMQSDCDAKCPLACPEISGRGSTCEINDPGCVCTEENSDSCHLVNSKSSSNILSESGTKRAGHSAVYYNHSMWIFGGYDFTTVVDTLDVYSVSDKKWIPLPYSNLSVEKPAGRYLHSAVILNSTMYILGGLNSRHIVVDDFWAFNISSGIWKSLPSSLPALAAHSATLVDNTIYVFGGYLKNGSLSNTIYIWSPTTNRWAVEYPKSGPDPFLRVAGHSAVYYAPLHSLVVFGGIRSTVVEEVLMYMYQIQEQIWTAVGQRFPPHSMALYSRLVFHRADVVGSYMIITGGYDMGNNRYCRESEVYLYHLDCQVFVTEAMTADKNFSFPDLNRFGHSTILSNNNLIIFGGLSDVMLNKLDILTLPDFVTSTGYHCVKDYADRAACEADLSCVWCVKSSEEDDHGVCVGQHGAQSICGAVSNPSCPGLCPALATCTSCLAFKQHQQCSWCLQASKCVVNGPANRDNCLDKRAKDTASPTKRPQTVDFIEQCHLPPVSSGLTFLLYQPDPDLQAPDEVNLIDNSALSFHPIVRFPPDRETGTLIVEMRGFLHPLGANPKSTWDTQLRMWERMGNSAGFDGVAQLWLSKDADPKNAELVAESRGIFPIKSEISRHDGSPLFPEADGTYYIKFMYQITVVKQRIPADFDVHLSLTWNGNSIINQAFETKNLEPFTTEGTGCNRHGNCLKCLSDMSCGWCPATQECFAKPSDPSNYSPCNSPSGDSIYLTVDVNQCAACHFLSDSVSCNGEKHCKWDTVAHGCYRSSLVSQDRSLTTEPDCTKHTSCSTCVHALEKCLWCHSLGQCLPRSSLNVLAAFGQCRFWENGEVTDPCTDCKEIKDCDICLSRPSCGWCSKVGKDPRQGECLTGNSVGLNLTDDLVCPRNGNGSGGHVWSYNTCPDVDECTLGIADCHENATCVNIRGDYRCECAPGYKGDGRTTCIKTCDRECVNGKCSDVLMPNLEPFKCICDLGWTGSQCEIDCGCNFHSTCTKNVSQCDQCFGNTEGQFCERCVRGTFGNATADKGCLPCSCNGHADTSQPCDIVTGRCHCEYPYFGRTCEKCPADFFGDPISGGICYSRCRSRTLILNATSGGIGNENDIADGFCLWILVSGKEDYFGDRLPLSLTIGHSMEVMCPNNSIAVTDGLPDWLVTADISTELAEDDTRLFDLWEAVNRPSSLLGNICGPLKTPMTLTSKSGIMTILFRKSSRSEKFNATYALEEGYGRRKRGISLIRLSSRVGHSIEVVKQTAYLFSGLDPIHGIVNDMWAISHEAMLTESGWTLLDDIARPRPLPRYFHASCVVGDLMVVHGGYVENADRVQVGNDLWVFNVTSRTWQELALRNLPRLAGHTMTVIRDIIYIIGGGAESFSDLVYSYKFNEPSWRVFPAEGSRPPGVYGHSATYYPLRNAIFVFGGYRFDIDRSGMSNMFSVLDLGRRRWILMPSLTQFTVGPLDARMFHAAKYIRSGNYIVIAGGRTPGDLSDNALLVYRLKCNQWLDESNPNITTLVSPSFMHFANESQQYLYLASGFSYAQSFIKFSRVEMVDDFCTRNANTRMCLATYGCGMCGMDNGSICFDNAVPGINCGVKGSMLPGITCDENFSVMKICREQKECRTCVAPWFGVGEDESRCQWCTNCGNGLCVERYESCESSLSCNRSNAIIKDPGMCPDERCHAADCQRCKDSKSGCFWTRHFQRSTETIKKFRKTPVFPWNCFPRELTQKLIPIPEDLEASPPGDCPPTCSRFEACSDCLNSGGSAGGFQQCAWSEDKEECLNPAMVNLRCPQGNCGALLYGGSKDRCQKDPKIITVCRECLRVPKAGWCAVDGSDGLGTCMSGGISGPLQGFCAASNNVSKAVVPMAAENDLKSVKSAAPIGVLEEILRHTWHFLSCPTENECANGHHTCDEASEECHDTPSGFNCTCKAGYAQTLSTDPDRSIKCSPICSQGCQAGRCTAPDTCKCDFGFVGANCSIACQCNGHSECPSENELTTCIQCMNNTVGDRCERCAEKFVGNAKSSGKCQSCKSYCNEHSENCLTLGQIFNASDNAMLPDNPFQGFDFMQLKNILDKDRQSNVHMCYKCDGNTTGYRCESCLQGFFRPPSNSKTSDPCRPCECNGHDDSCNPFTGTNCKCANNTATEAQCDGTDKKDSPTGAACWTVQCAQCKEYFIGRPTNGHHCYRSMSVGEDYCFDPEMPRGRCSNWDSSKPLRQGRTVFFAVQPKYLNVDIRIYIDVTVGGVDFFLSDQDDMFTIRVKSTGLHDVNVERKYTPSQRGSEPVYDGIVDYHRIVDLVSYVTAAEQNKVVIVRDIRHRLVLTIPYYGHDLKNSKFYIVVHGMGSPLSDATRGRIMFRQDQPHIDLFVFFSVFFSCFFLFLAICILLWKFKHVYGIRQNRQRVAIEMQTMAKRPFGKVFLVFDKKNGNKPTVVNGFTMETDLSVPDEASTSKCTKKVVPKLRKKRRNLIDPSDPSSTGNGELTPAKVVKYAPVAMEYLHGGMIAVATLPIELPGGPDCPVRFCMASTLVTAPQFFSANVVKND